MPQVAIGAAAAALAAGGIALAGGAPWTFAGIVFAKAFATNLFISAEGYAPDEPP